MLANSIFLEKNSALRRKLVLNLPREKTSKCFALFKKIIKTDPSPVIRHEVAFILGSMKDSRSAEILIDIVKNDDSDLVRHEAIEALGDNCIVNKKVVGLLKKLDKNQNPFIRDTAEIASQTLTLRLDPRPSSDYTE